MSPVAASALINPPVLAEPHASLLAGLGGTPPEFLGPAQDELVQDEPPFSEDRSDETQAHQGSNPNFPGFRENEWDLASVTMVPRKRSKPEGLSALGLLLLWIAIPSFGIGIMVGRRPLQQWLSRGFAERKNISHVDAPEPEIARARDESPDITSSDIDATGPQSILARSGETPATRSSQDVKASAATKSFVSTPAFVDTQLLNSMSTQERRAAKAPASTALPENPNANETKVDLKAEANAAVVKNSSSSSAAVVKPVTRTNTLAASTNVPTNHDNASARRGDSNYKSAVAPPVARRHAEYCSQQSRSACSGFLETEFRCSGCKNCLGRFRSYPRSASNVPESRPAAVNAMPPAVSHIPSSSVASPPATANLTTHQNASGPSPVTQSVSNNAPAAVTQSVNHSASPVPGAAGNSVASSSPVSDASRNNNTALTASKTQPAPASSPTGTTYGFQFAELRAPRIAPDVSAAYGAECQTQYSVQRLRAQLLAISRAWRCHEFGTRQCAAAASRGNARSEKKQRIIYAQTAGRVGS